MGCARVSVFEKMIAHILLRSLLVRSQLASAYVFAIALSLHSFFEGLGIGAESQMVGFVTLMVAMIMHKVVEALA